MSETRPSLPSRRDEMSDQVSFAPPVDDGRRQGMRAPDEVAAMLRLRALGWGTRRIATELGCDRETVRRYLAAGGWAPYRPPARPGRQLQIDFGERAVRIGEETVRVHLFVATLGYSRRVYVRAFRHQRQSAWLDGIEGAFRH